jgi:hypothetical protein
VSLFLLKPITLKALQPLSHLEFVLAYEHRLARVLLKDQGLTDGREASAAGERRKAGRVIRTPMQEKRIPEKRECCMPVHGTGSS